MAERAGNPADLAVRLVQDSPIPLDVSFACAPGEMLALVGPSGGGKTTVLRSIAGLYRPGRGHVACAAQTWLDTERGIDTPAHRRSVGYVFQSYALFPHMTAEANVAAALGHLPAGQRPRRARELLAAVRLAGLERRRPNALSGGQQQRVAVARALARDPAALLLDEPFSAVDRATRQRLYRELAELRRSLKIPVILVTHDLEEAALLADRMCILHHGRTLQAGSPVEVTTKPTTVEVARLVDIRNVFEGLVLEHRPTSGLTLLSWLGYELEASYQPAFAPGERVSWCIPTGGVLTHRRDRPSRGERENPITGVVVEFLRLGEEASVALQVDGATEPLVLTAPAHVAARNGIEIGARISVSLLAERIHLMPWQELGRSG